MLPEKHIRDLESSHRKSRVFSNSAVALLFITAFLLLGPAIHELAHVSLLELRNCSYLFDIDFLVPNGINAEVEPLCVISPGYLLFFYSSGYLATLTAGVALNIAGSIARDESLSGYLAALGTGMLLSVILTIGVEGDIQNALEVMKLDAWYGSLVALVIVLGVFAAGIHGLENMMDLEREE